MIDENTLKNFITLIIKQTGIIPLESHKKGIAAFIEKRSVEICGKNNADSYKKYFNILLSDESELAELMNAATINETYFFREQPQFEFLCEKFLPQWKIKNYGKRIKIWSAASSIGQEAYSLALASLSQKITPFITATDINRLVIEKCREGSYPRGNSMRADGEKFHHMLKPYLNDGNITFPPEIKSVIVAQKLNLLDLLDSKKAVVIPPPQDIIFIRNVFIYFSPETKKALLQTIAEKCLTPNGIIFVSMNEIASIDNDTMGKSLCKENDGKVFYFRKVEGGV